MPIEQFWETAEGDELPDAAAVAWQLFANEHYHDEEFSEQFRRFLDSVDVRRVRAVLVQEWNFDTSSDIVVELFTAHAAEFPELRAIFLAPESAGDQISWIQHGDVTPLLEAFPKLERLDVRGNGPHREDPRGLRLRPVRHDALRMLRFESGG
ncbi:leucine-rich repeat domain-containing protein, partial [Bailinhaonella thermotolerans]